MAAMQVEVKIQDLDEMKPILSNLGNLMEQIEKSDFRDEMGHELKMNKSYNDLKESIENLGGSEHESL